MRRQDSWERSTRCSRSPGPRPVRRAPCPSTGPAPRSFSRRRLMRGGRGLGLRAEKVRAKVILSDLALTELDELSDATRRRDLPLGDGLRGDRRFEGATDGRRATGETDGLSKGFLRADGVHTEVSLAYPNAESKTCVAGRKRGFQNTGVSIHKALKRARENRRPKLSQEAVAGSFAPPIKRAAVAQWESEKGTFPTADRLPHLAKLYGVTTDELLGLTPPPGAPRVAEDRQGLRYSGLTDEALDVAHAWAALPEVRKGIYRELVMRDASINDVEPHLFTVGLKPSYFKMITSIRHDHEVKLRQRDLFKEGKK
jgi:transcriptional regulator with XRE-family HTH domain